MTIVYEYSPGALYLNVTNRCSNDCDFCVRQGSTFSLAGYPMRLAVEPSAEEVLAAVRQHRGPLREVVFCGFGEPTCRLELVGRVGRALRKEGQRVRLNTNGQAALIHGQDPWSLLDSALDAVSISLNAPDAVTYAALCRPRFGEAAFVAVRQFVRQAIQHVEQVKVTVVGFSLDGAQIARCQRWAEEQGADFRVR